MLRQHNTFMAAPGTVDQFGEMTVGLRNRTRVRHPSTVQLDADGCRYGAPTAAAQRRGPFRGRLPAESVSGFGPARNCPKATMAAPRTQTATMTPRACRRTRVSHPVVSAAVNADSRQVTAVSPRPLTGA